MAIIRRRTGLVRAKSDRRSVWLGIDVDQVNVGANTVILLSSLNAAALALRPFTVVRTRIRILWESDQTAASEQPHGALGAIVVSDQAVAAGAASVPDPISNSDAPFFLYEPLIARFVFVTGAGFESNGGLQVLSDSKSMRKVGNNEDVPFMIVNSDGSHGATVAITGRMLVKLH